MGASSWLEHSTPKLQMSKKSNTSYVLVHVTYDYYRFQHNLGCALTIGDARKLAAKASAKLGIPVVEDIKLSPPMENDGGRAHIFIERLSTTLNYD